MSAGVRFTGGGPLDGKLRVLPERQMQYKVAEIPAVSCAELLHDAVVNISTAKIHTYRRKSAEQPSIFEYVP